VAVEAEQRTAGTEEEPLSLAADEARREAGRARRKRAAVFLVPGYVLAVPGSILVQRIVRERNLPAFVGLEAGTALIITGWSIWPRPRSVAINVAALFGFGAYWIIEGRKQRGPRGLPRRLRRR
jgi:hypothetical protein